MAAFPQRPLCYQVGVLVLIAATSVFAAAVALPWWAQTYSRTNQIIRHSGLWLGCSSAAVEKCSAIEAPDWFKAVQGLQCAALALMALASLYAVFANCCLDQLTFSRTVEVASGAGGVLGVLSALIYVAKTSHVLRKSQTISYSWAFAMDIAAAIVVVFVAAIVGLSNNRHLADEDARLIIEDGYDDIRYGRIRRGGGGVTGRIGGRRGQGGGGAGLGAGLGAGRSPGRTRRLGATSGSVKDVVVMQNNVGPGPPASRPQSYLVSPPAPDGRVFQWGAGPCPCCSPSPAGAARGCGGQGEGQGCSSPAVSLQCGGTQAVLYTPGQPSERKEGGGGGAVILRQHCPSCHCSSSCQTALGPVAPVAPGCVVHASVAPVAPVAPGCVTHASVAPVAPGSVTPVASDSVAPGSVAPVASVAPTPASLQPWSSPSPDPHCSCGKAADDKCSCTKPSVQADSKTGLATRLIASAPPLDSECEGRVDFATAQCFVQPEAGSGVDGLTKER